MIFFIIYIIMAEEKKPLKGFFKFLGEKREEIKKSLPKNAGVKDVAKKAGEMWRKMTPNEKKKYD